MMRSRPGTAQTSGAEQLGAGTVPDQRRIASRTHVRKSWKRSCTRSRCAASGTHAEGPATMQDFYVKVGDSVTFAKTVGETDIYLFAGITGDFSVNHVNEPYMAKSKFGRRIAHGALIVGSMSTCSPMMIAKCRGAPRSPTPSWL